MDAIRIRLDGTACTARPDGYLGGERFGSYVAACRAAGWRYDATKKAQVGSPDAVARLVEELAAARFQARVDDAIVALQRATEEVAKESVAGASDRLTRAEQALQGSGLAPYPFQRDGVRWLAGRRTALLADEMGLGKTPQALLAVPEGAAVLVIAPASVKGVWALEASRWRPDLRPVVLSGRNSFRWPDPGEILVTNWDILSATPGSPQRPIYVVADEAHAVKSKKALRTKRFRMISEATRKAGGSVFLLTGTPMINRPPELWSVLEAADLAKEAFGSWPRFCDLFGAYKRTIRARGGRRIAITEWGTPRPEVPGLLHRVSLRRCRADVLPDLPVKTWRDIPVDIDRATIALLDAVVEEMKAAGIDIEKADKITDLSARGVAFERMSEARAALATAKIPVLLDLVADYEESEEPVVVFSAHRAPVDALGLRDGWATITGDTKAEDRSAIVARFQAGEIKGLAATIQAGGVGITLTRSSHVMFVDLAWTPALNQQAEDRLCRIGQTRGVVVTRLVADHILDQRVSELLERKTDLITATVVASARTDVKPPSPSYDVRETFDGQPADEGLWPTPNQQENGNGRRAPQSAIEKWASAGLLTVAAMDPDHAGKLNAVGFSRYDNKFGHSLARQIGVGKLTDKQWACAIRLANKYRRQIGAKPTEEVI